MDLNNSTEAKSKKQQQQQAALGPGQSLNAEWLRKYLVHLRLTKKSSSAAGATSTKALSSGTGTGTGTSGDAARASQRATPLLWKEWLGKKMQVAVKPRAFKKALNGEPHPLSKEDIELMIKRYDILPAEALQQEVECRIESWLLDVNGSRAFPHELNMHIRKWIFAKDKKGNWKTWQKLPSQEKQSVKKDIMNTIIKEKREELLAQERKSYEITIDLYKKYDREVTAARSSSATGAPWTSWLDSHLTKFKKSLDEFRSSEKERMQRVEAEASRRKTVAGLTEIKSKLLKAKDDHKMDSYRTAELLRAMQALERAAAARGLAKGTLVAKEDFDKHIKPVLVPFINMDEDIGSDSGGENVKPRSNNSVGKKDIEAMFYSEPDQAVDKVKQAAQQEHQKQQQKQEKDYTDWLERKDRERAEQLQLKREQRKKELFEKKERQKRNEKALKKWEKLHRKNMYLSQVDKKKHPIPSTKVIAHKEKWRADKDLNDYYAELEKQY